MTNKKLYLIALKNLEDQLANNEINMSDFEDQIETLKIAFNIK